MNLPTSFMAATCLFLSALGLVACSLEMPIVSDSEVTEPEEDTPVMSTNSNDPTAAEIDANVVLLTDFTDPARNARWSVVNDNVMGGRSDGRMAMTMTDLDQGIMTLAGNINTNGGGFTSVRMRIDPTMFTSEQDAAVLPELRAVRLTVRGDAASLKRPFALRLEDNIRRQRGINYRALLPLDPNADPDQWQTIEIAVADMQPTWRGNRLNPNDWAPLDTAQLARLGIILSDVRDGPYRLEIERIEFLR